MTTIYELQQRAKMLRTKTQTGSITPDEVGSLHEDTLAHIATLEQSADSLGIKKVYPSKSAMEADTTPVGNNGKTIRYGQLVCIYDLEHPDSADNGDVYVFQQPSWLVIGNIKKDSSPTIVQQTDDGKTLQDVYELTKNVDLKDVLNIDVSEFSMGYIEHGTGIIKNEYGRHTGYIRAFERDVIVVTDKEPTSLNIDLISAYDEEKRYLSGSAQESKFICPQKTAYVVMSWRAQLNTERFTISRPTSNILSILKVNLEEVNQKINNKTPHIIPKRCVEQGFIDKTTGKKTMNTIMKCMRFVPVSEGDVILLSKMYMPDKNSFPFSPIVFYDSHKSFLESVNDITSEGTLSVTTPKGAEYVSFSWKGDRIISVGENIITIIPKSYNSAVTSSIRSYVNDRIFGVDKFIGKKINIIGDSISDGVGSGFKWWQLTAQSLGLSIGAITETMPGVALTEFAEKIKDKNVDGDIFIIAGGMNDLGVANVELGTFDYSKPIAVQLREDPTLRRKFIPAYRNLIETILTKKTDTVIYLCTITPRAIEKVDETIFFPYINAVSGCNWVDYNNAVRKLARDYGLGLIDFGTLGFTQVGEVSKSANGNNWSTDGVHPDAACQERMSLRATQVLINTYV